MRRTLIPRIAITVGTALVLGGCGTPPTSGIPTSMGSAPIASSMESSPPDGPGQVPGPEGKTPAERYAYCLRLADIPAVVIDGLVAIQDSEGPGVTSHGADQAAAVDQCRRSNPDYVDPAPSGGTGGRSS